MTNWKGRTCEGCEYLCMESDLNSSAVEYGDFECRRFPPTNEMSCTTFTYPVVMCFGVMMKACAEYKPTAKE